MIGDDLPAVSGEWNRAGVWLIDRYETDDAHMADLAATAVAALTERLRSGAGPHAAVQEIVWAVFGGGTAAEAMDRAPDGGPDDPERAMAMLADPATIDRIAAAALDVLRLPPVRASAAA